MQEKLEVATLGGGCFWCTEAIFKRLKGVVSVTSGYSGGKKENPSYDEVCRGITGHAEAIQITFDPAVIPYKTLLDVFWATHNPTTLNQQGNDIGTQYRSVIFYHSNQQKEIAEESKKSLASLAVYHDPIVTEITPFTNFYKAERYYENYYEKNQDAPYCQFVISPKIQKLMTEFKKELKEKYQQPIV